MSKKVTTTAPTTTAVVATVKTSKTPTLDKKMDIARRICESMNSKKFKWNFDQATGIHTLSGLEDFDVAVTFAETKNEAHVKGFRVTSANGKEVYQPGTLDVGIFLSSIKEMLDQVVNPPVFEKETVSA